ncbi:MAG: hypothetical protein ACOY4F_12760 [Thermodesulfobacteriota bacterium]
MIEITEYRERMRLTISAMLMGDDLWVALAGHGRPHIGAVAVSRPRPSPDGAGTTTATTSVLAVVGHKEDQIARRMAARLASTLGAVVIVSCGIHLEGASERTTENITETVAAMTEDLIDEVTFRRSIPTGGRHALEASPLG